MKWDEHPFSIVNIQYWLLKSGCLVDHITMYLVKSPFLVSAVMSSFCVAEMKPTMSQTLPCLLDTVDLQQKIIWNPMNISIKSPIIPLKTNCALLEIPRQYPLVNKHSYGQSPFYSWVNPLFRLGHFLCRKLLVYQRVNTIPSLYPSKPKFSANGINHPWRKQTPQLLRRKSVAWKLSWQRGAWRLFFCPGESPFSRLLSTY